MDNFMDRLAQRLNAQEVIRANVAAETAELEQLRDQVEAYDESLRKMQLMSDANAENVVKMEAILDAYSSQLDGYDEELTRYADRLENYGAELTQYAGKLQECQEIVAKTGETSDATKEALEANLAQLKDNLAGMQEHIEDFSHKENVKVYRNVQVAVGEELNKKVTELTEMFCTKLEEETTQRTEQNQDMQKRQEELGRQLAGVQELLNQILDRSSSKGGKAMIVLQVLSLLALIANLVILLFASGII